MSGSRVYQVMCGGGGSGSGNGSTHANGCTSNEHDSHSSGGVLVQTMQCSRDLVYTIIIATQEQ